MIIRKLRLQKNWTQDQLAKFSGLNIRTIQRIERSRGASIESLKSLAAVFEIPVNELQEELEMADRKIDEKDESIKERALEHVHILKSFYQHLSTFICFCVVILTINLLVDPGELWSKWPIFLWGIGVVIYGFKVYRQVGLCNVDWEKMQVEKRLGKL
jgi:transcriptional regulator with XRE-family HTH domain